MCRDIPIDPLERVHEKSILGTSAADGPAEEEHEDADEVDDPKTKLHVREHGDHKAAEVKEYRCGCLLWTFPVIKAVAQCQIQMLALAIALLTC